MKAFWAKSNIYILTLAGLAVVVYMALTWNSMPAGQRALGFFVAGIVLHEWEEMRFPGGFYELMTKKLGIGGMTDEQVGLSHGVVAAAILFFAFLPFLIWPVLPWFAGIPAILGFFEALIHIAGIKIHRLKRPYTPGMATALLCLLPASICIVVFAMPDVPAWQWVLALMCYIAIFACMEFGVWRVFGIDPRSLPARMRSNIADK